MATANKFIMEEKNQNQNNLLDQLLDAGVHLGRKKSVCHPKMKPFVFTTRQNISIINVDKTAQKMQEAAEFLKGVASKGGTILFVAVAMPAKPLVKQLAEGLNMPYVSERWIGGTLTNFNVISKRIQYFLKQEEKKAKGEFEKYTKKEQLDMEEELKDLEKKMGGIKTLTKHPDVIFLVDAQEHSTAVREANKVGIPMVGILNTNSDPEAVTYPIPANDKSVKSLKFILDYIEKSIKEGLSTK